MLYKEGMSIGELLLAHRLRLGYTQAQVNTISARGKRVIGTKRYRRWENDQIVPRTEMCRIICTILNINLGMFANFVYPPQERNGAMNNVRNIMARKGLSMPDIQARSGLGKSIVYAIAHCVEEPRVSVGIKVAKALGVPIEEVWTMVEDPDAE